MSDPRVPWRIRQGRAAGSRGAGPPSCGAAGLPARISGSLGNLCAPLPGMGCDGLGCDGMGWDETRWDGMGRLSRGAGSTPLRSTPSGASRRAAAGGGVAVSPHPTAGWTAPRLCLPRRHPAVTARRRAASSPHLSAAPKLLHKFGGGAWAPHRTGSRRRWPRSGALPPSPVRHPGCRAAPGPYVMLRAGAGLMLRL